MCAGVKSLVNELTFLSFTLRVRLSIRRYALCALRSRQISRLNVYTCLDICSDVLETTVAQTWKLVGTVVKLAIQLEVIGQL